MNISRSDAPCVALSRGRSFVSVAEAATEFVPAGGAKKLPLCSLKPRQEQQPRHPRACASTRLRNPRRAPRQARASARLGPKPAQRLCRQVGSGAEPGRPYLRRGRFRQLDKLDIVPLSPRADQVVVDVPGEHVRVPLRVHVPARHFFEPWRRVGLEASAHVLKWSPIT